VCVCLHLHPCYEPGAPPSQKELFPCPLSEQPPPLLLLYSYGHPPLEFLVPTLVVAVHLVVAVLAPLHGIVRPALLVIDPQVRTEVAVVVRHVRDIHLLLCIAGQRATGRENF